MFPLTLVHVHRNLVDVLRVPVMLLSVTLTPVSVLVFFFVPFIDDAQLMTIATGTFVVFAVLLACVVHVATVTAHQRQSSWGVYLRTLPGGPGPSMISHVIVGMIVVATAVLPVVAVAALFTPATAPPGRVLLALAALLAVVVTFTLLGLAIGYTLSAGATMVATSIVILPLAVAGGMFFDPSDTPAIISAIAPFTPTGGANDLVLSALTGAPLRLPSTVMLIAWTIVFALVAGWGYRRDEGRRFS